MSLLLDALKKAAQQKKAKDKAGPEENKVDEVAGNGDPHDLDETALTATAVTESAITDTVSTTFDSTVVDEYSYNVTKDATEKTEIDGTEIDGTEIDGTEIDGTEIDVTGVDTNLADNPRFDITELDKTELDKTEVDNTDLDETNKEKESQDTFFTETETSGSSSTEPQDETETGAVEAEETRIDEDALELVTDSDETQNTAPVQLQETVEIAAITDIAAINEKDTLTDEDDLQLHKKLEEPQNTDSIRLDESSETATISDDLLELEPVTERPDKAAAQSEETMEIESKFIEETDFDYDELSSDTIASDNDPTELGEDFKFADSTELDVTENTDIRVDTILRNQSLLSDEDRSLYIIDGAETDYIDETDEQSIVNEKEAFASIQAKYKHHLADDKDSLTEDDVTQFMGDGVSERSTGNNVSTEESTDDTTSNNPDEVLTMTNFSFEDQDSAATNDLTENDTSSLHEYNSKPSADQTTSVSLSQVPISEDDKSTRINTEATSTVSSIDIEQLTNDGIVPSDPKTSSRPYAPDNYDRTLLNLSEKDVSNIFPGMKPSSDTVMTPDYAKRIFLSKSSQVKTRFFKMYAGIALIILLSVVILGLFQLQEESMQMDNGLISLKRDPMPGAIKPYVEKTPERLFVPESDSPDITAIEIISTADEPVSTPDEAEQDGSDSSMVVENVDAGEHENQPLTPVNVAQPPVQEKVATASEVKPVASNLSSSTLSISSGQQVSDKNQILNKAYDAYDSGDMASAKSLYNKVLVLDATNRDALLGRAAIYIQDNEYQQAINMYQQLLLENPKDSIAMTSLISVANIEPQEAETQLKKLLREQPDSPYILFVLGNMYGSQNRWSEAQTAYFDALQKTPDNPNYAYNLAVSLEHLGKTAPAIDFYKRALNNSTNGLITFDNQLVMQRIEVLTQ